MDARSFAAGVPASLNARTRYGTEIESVYLIGDFGVKAAPADHPLADTYRNRDGVLPKRPIHSFKSFTLTAEAAASRTPGWARSMRQPNHAR